MAVYQGHLGAADLADLEVDPVVALSGGIVVEPDNIDIDREVGKIGVSHVPVDGDGLGVAHVPVVVPLAGVGNGLDGGP